jgi:GntR family transcriptional regulator/MocR family aminotransferase
VEGLPRLRRVIAEYIARTRGLPVAPERVVITVGAAQAVDLMLRSLTPISKLAIEEPGPEPVRRVLQLHGIRPLPIPVDEQGLRVESLPDNESAPKVVHVIPSHQYPTGWAMSLERRAKLLAWADAHDSAVIEDDYDSEFRYDRSPPIALAALDRSQRVIYIGSFSKTMFPGLRLGFCIVPERFIGRFLDLKWFSDRCVPIFEQLALAEWIESGTLEQHIRKMRKIYAQRRNALLSALNLHFGKTVRVLGVPAGMHMMLDLDLKLSEVEVMERAISRGIKLYPASPCFIAPRSQGSSLIIGFGHLSSERIAVGVHRLAGALGREIKR